MEKQQEQAEQEEESKPEEERRFRQGKIVPYNIMLPAGRMQHEMQEM